MKSLRFSMVAMLAFLGSAAFAQSKTDSVNVSGNCGMCKKRIEAAVKVDGVTAAEWSAKTKMLTLSYDSGKIKLDDVQRKIADVGHDTQKFKATEAVYDKLPGCCKYDRTSKPAKQPASDHKH
ncbi:MAG: heavy-metal-associated domain-containing protein [Bacteroidota bacterium]